MSSQRQTAPTPASPVSAAPLPAARVREAVAKVLAGIAPEADLAGLPPAANLRRELDLDSVDFQRFLAGLARELGRDIPDREAGGLTTLAACEAFFGAS
jgi:acyl carrier protein